MSLRRLQALLSATALVCFGAGIAAQEADEAEEEETAIVEAEDAEEAEEAEDSEVEEVIVTGSFIRRDSFDLPSPIDTIDELDLEFAATPDIGDVIFDQTYQIGVNANSAPFEFNVADDQGGRSLVGAEVFPNLRGLGTRATMTMMDGHRVPANVTGYSFWTRRAGSDATNLYPGITIGRVETILDGASALYGSEAVSGVVNFIPRKNFEGLITSYEAQYPEDTSLSKRFGLLAGAQGERTSAIFGLEIRDQPSIPATDRPEFIVASAGWTGQLLPTYGERGQSLPGDWRVPHRFPDGTLENPPLSGWQRFDSGNAPPGWFQTSGPWFRYPEGYPGQNSYEYQGERFGYSTSRADNQGQLRIVPRYDPGCMFPFGGGHDDLGDPSTKNEFDLGYNDTRLPGNFLNGYVTGNVRGRETRTIGDEANSHGASEDCRQVTADWQDIRDEREQEQAMAYFQHEFNDNFTARGEIVASRLNYSTRNRAHHIDEWDEGSTLFGRNVAVAIGSNPGNPFRAFADGSNSCHLVPDLAGCDVFNDRFNTYRERRGNEIGNDNVIDERLTADTFLSYEDTNGNGVYDYFEEAGELLIYAQDANGDGLPDRDFNGDGIADETELGDRFGQTDPANRVVLLSAENDSDGDGIPDRFDPDSHGAGGVRLFEDVRMNNVAPHPKQPYVHESYPWLNKDMSFDYRRVIQNLRLRVGGTYTIPNTEWLVDADWIWAQRRSTDDYLEPVWPFTVAALRCQGGTDGDQCWNPFSTAWLDSDPETGEILPAWRDKEDPAWNTATETRGAGLIMRQDRRSTETHIVDLVASNGSVFDLWYNDAPVGMAFGFHHRTESESQQPNQLSESLWGSARYVGQKTVEETNAVFAEIQIHPISHPTWGQMEVQIASRYAEFEAGGSIAGGDTAQFEVNIPKFAMRYQPGGRLDWLAFRASRTEGFVLPGMFQLFGEEEAYTDTTIVSDYTCNLVWDAPHCGFALGGGGRIPGVLAVNNAPNEDLDAEISELWNAGVSVRLLDGRFAADLDYTEVDFNGRVERLGIGAILNNASIGFENHMKDRCGDDTLIDYDNTTRWPDDENPGIPRTREDYLAQTPASEVECRAAAVADWISREQSLAGATIVRAPNGLLLEVNDGWVNQGEQTTRTLIFNSTFSFDSSDIPFVDGDFGGFSLNFSATKMLELSIERYAAGSAHTFAGVRVDGVGTRNTDCCGGYGEGEYLALPLPPTPEYRVNMGLRWFRGPHSAQLSVRWHDSLRDVNAAWDEVLAVYQRVQRENGVPEEDWDPNGWHGDQINGVDATGWTEETACADQDRNPYCRVDSRHYWDLSYTYNRPDMFGLGYVSVNVAMRNIFGTMPDPWPSGAGYENYLDDIMGRQAFARITLGF